MKKNELKLGNIFIVLLLLLAGLVDNSLTIDVNGRCEVIEPTSNCAPLLPYTTLYLNETNTQDGAQLSAATIFGLKEYLPFECQDPVLTLVCLTLYPPCVTINDTISPSPIYLPSLPCYNICTTANNELCGPYIQQVMEGFTCEYSSDGIPQYPAVSTTYNLTYYGGPSDEIVLCNSRSNSLNANESESCFPPLVYVEPEKRHKNTYIYVKDFCALPCPFHVYDPVEYTKFRNTKIITYTLSFFSSIYLLVVYAVLPNQITNRMEIISSFASGGIMVSISYYMEFAESSKNFDDFVCTSDPGRYTFQSDAKCGFNAFFFHFGLLVSVAWWVNICYDFYLTMRIQRNEHFKKLRLISWGIPLICTIAPFAGKKFGASLGTSGCWILAGNDTAWPFLCFYIPIYICILISFFFLASSIRKIYQTYHLVPSKRIVVFNVRMIIFMVWVCFSITFGCFNNFYLDAKAHQFVDQVVLYFDCLRDNNNDQSMCFVSFPYGDFRLLNILATSTTGFAGFLGLGVDDAHHLWSESSKIHFIAMIIKKSSFYNYILLKLGKENITATTNSSSSSNNSSGSGSNSKGQWKSGSTTPSSSSSSREARREKRKTMLMNKQLLLQQQQQQQQQQQGTLSESQNISIELDTFNSNQTIETSDVLTNTNTNSTNTNTNTNTTSTDLTVTTPNQTKLINIMNIPIDDDNNNNNNNNNNIFESSQINTVIDNNNDDSDIGNDEDDTTSSDFDEEIDNNNNNNTENINQDSLNNSKIRIIYE